MAYEKSRDKLSKILHRMDMAENYPIGSEERRTIDTRIVTWTEDAAFCVRNESNIYVFNTDEYGYGDRGYAKFRVMGEVLEITLPRLLSRKHTQKQEVNHFYSAMYSGDFKKFSSESGFKIAEPYVIWLCHEYAEGKKDWSLPDSDNMESKALVDMVARLIGTDDAHCSTFVTTHIAETDCTRVYVLPSRIFPQFLNDNFEKLTK